MKHHAIRAAAAALALAILPAVLPAQDLPPAEEIIERYVEAIGGRDAVTSQPGSRSTGTFAMPAAGIEATMEVYAATDPVRTISITQIPGMGEIREGYTGEYAWAMDPNMGARLLTGEELTQAKENASVEGQLRDASMFTERTTVERTEMNGEACYRVKLVWKSGREAYDCYSVDSGLRIAQETVQTTPMGDISIVSMIEGYEEHGGVMTPTRVRQQAMGQEQIITIDSIEVMEIDDDVFTPPAAIQSLIEQQESGG